jgi:hypothetical protein
VIGRNNSSISIVKRRKKEKKKKMNPSHGILIESNVPMVSQYSDWKDRYSSVIISRLVIDMMNEVNRMHMFIVD